MIGICSGGSGVPTWANKGGVGEKVVVGIYVGVSVAEGIEGGVGLSVGVAVDDRVGSGVYVAVAVGLGAITLQAARLNSSTIAKGARYLK